jgi:CBS-domain-containing membrane protein
MQGVNKVDERIEKAIREPVNVVMSKCPLAIQPDAPIPRVLEQFSRQSNHPLMVIEPDGTLAGVITPMDLISALTPSAGTGGRHRISGLDRYLKSTAQNARDLISDEPMTIHKDATIGDALRRMEHSHSPSVIIVDENEAAVGCIELADIIAYLHRSLSR